MACVATCMTSMVEWKGWYARIQQEILSQCIIGSVAHLSGGEHVSMKTGNSIAAL